MANHYHRADLRISYFPAMLIPELP